jgi:hypothetical protein
VTHHQQRKPSKTQIIVTAIWAFIIILTVCLLLAGCLSAVLSNVQ